MDVVGQDLMSMTHWFPSQGKKAAVKVTFVLCNLGMILQTPSTKMTNTKCILEVRPQVLPAPSKPLQSVAMLKICSAFRKTRASIHTRRDHPVRNRSRAFGK